MQPAERRAAPGPQPVPADLHRAAARLFASGVTVAAARHGGRVHAIAATAFCSLSLDPPLVLLAVNQAGRLVELTDKARHIGISVLGEDQREISEWAGTAGRTPGEKLPFPSSVARTGAPLIQGAIAWFDCQVQDIRVYGDHIVVVALVVEAWASEKARPLLYFDGTYHALGKPLGRRSDPDEPGGLG
jgi:3-hydroxy-9,10-secoandrosta-1,3,5(10)-triene-9,17-dione monooxygenase reductase component